MFQLTPHQIDFMDTLLATATPERLRHLQQLMEHIPDVV